MPCTCRKSALIYCYQSLRRPLDDTLPMYFQDRYNRKRSWTVALGMSYRVLRKEKKKKRVIVVSIPQCHHHHVTLINIATISVFKLWTLIIECSDTVKPLQLSTSKPMPWLMHLNGQDFCSPAKSHERSDEYRCPSFQTIALEHVSEHRSQIFFPSKLKQIPISKFSECFHFKISAGIMSFSIKSWCSDKTPGKKERVNISFSLHVRNIFSATIFCTQELRTTKF